jgi:hypothetical protein
LYLSKERIVVDSRRGSGVFLAEAKREDEVKEHWRTLRRSVGSGEGGKPSEEMVRLPRV